MVGVSGVGWAGLSRSSLPTAHGDAWDGPHSLRSVSRSRVVDVVWDTRDTRERARQEPLL